MCHSITWYYALCQHPDPEAASLIACHRAFQTGYECTEEHQKTTQFPLIGSCLTCKLDKLMQRQSISREWRRGNLSSALNDAFQYTDGDSWTIDDSEAEELDMETLTSQSPSSSTSRVENRETRASFHRGPARTPTIVQPSSPHVSSVALVEYADDFADDEDEANSQPVQEPQTRSSRTWRSWIPLPTRAFASYF
ncbi:unnamed protein product [Penicillium glandicola]